MTSDQLNALLELAGRAQMSIAERLWLATLIAELQKALPPVNPQPTGT